MVEVYLAFLTACPLNKVKTVLREVRVTGTTDGQLSIRGACHPFNI
ncbi:hypothetical protein [Neobacillus cucumis]|nr:hypothetical protein [Neobacillus cucumis]